MTNRRLWMVPMLITAAATGACSAKVTSGSGSAWEGGPLWADYCESRRQLCDLPLDGCEEQEGCARALLRDEIEPALFQCLATTCDSDACLAEIINTFPATEVGEKFRASHQSFLAACPDGNDDVAVAAWIIADDRLDAFQACVEAPSCPETDACFEQVDATQVSICEDWL